LEKHIIRYRNQINLRNNILENLIEFVKKYESSKMVEYKIYLIDEYEKKYIRSKKVFIFLFIKLINKIN
jgi:hypothetical protein